MHRKQDESDLWNLASALMQVLETILSMEGHMNDQELLRALANHAITTGKELVDVLATIEAVIDE